MAVPPGKQINGFTGQLEDAKAIELQMSDIEQRKVAAGDMLPSEVKDPADYEDPEGRKVVVGETFVAPPKDEQNAVKTTEKKEEKREAVHNPKRSRTAKG